MDTKKRIYLEMSQAETIFAAAREIEAPAERAAYIELACGSDNSLAVEVNRLLATAEKAQAFFGTREFQIPAVQPEDQIGSTIGDCRLVQKIGEGGMGTVYLADQLKPFRRQVALKIIKLGMDTRQTIARFALERQALALMDHPNIAKVLDAGCTQNGRPYFVMELVQGPMITNFAAERHLSIPQRLKLFLDVCSAVQHAHQKGIIHRDLKPSNILVATTGDMSVPKVIDFGIAKAIGQQITDRTAFTQLQQFLGTPAYTSPEQLEGLDVHTRSDIYGLGVLLYELLTGSPPFDNEQLRTAGWDGIRRIIREIEPKRPSDLVYATKHLSLATDLDWIVMRCLEKDRTRRYETASSLAADIQLYLAGEPILARPPSRIYRLTKFVQRNKVQVAASFAVAAALVVGTVVSTWQAINARKAQRASKEQAETARTVKDFLVRQLLGSANPWERSAFDTNNYVIIQRAAREVEGQLTNQPLVEADVRYALGEALEGLDRFAEALSHYQKALALRTKHLGATHSDTLLAAAQVSLNLHNLERDGEADHLLNQAISLIRKSALKPSKGAGEVLFTRGAYLITKDRVEEGMACVKEALEMFERSLGLDHERTFVAQFMMAVAMQRLGKVGAAETLFKNHIARCIQVKGAVSPLVALFLKGYGLLLISQQRWNEAVEKLRPAVDIHRKILSADHTHTLESEAFLAAALEGKGDLEAATELRLDLHQRWAKHLPYFRARDKLRETAAFFVRHRRYADARAVFSDLQKFLPHLPPENPHEFEMLLATTAAVEGWPAAAEICRANLSRLSESLSTSLMKAWLFVYTKDYDSYQSLVTQILEVPINSTANNEQHLPIEIAGLAPLKLSDAQRNRLDALAQNLTADLGSQPQRRQRWAYRALAQYHFRSGRSRDALGDLERSSAAGSADPYSLFIQALCLKSLDLNEDARSAFNQAEILMAAQLPQPLKDSENFLAPAQLFQLVHMRAETKAAFLEK